jgi:uncharacterized protein YcnI
MKKARFTLTTGAALGLGAVLALGAPQSASAHVTLDDDTAEAGSYALLTFKVPNESDTATTTRITVTLPTDTPFVNVRTVPVAGWSAEVVETTLPEPVEIGETTIAEAPTSIVWTATGDGLAATELGLFPFSVGPVPNVGRLELPVDQGYSDGRVVAWAGEDVPLLYVNDEPEADHHGGEDVPEADGTASSDPLAVTGIVLGSGGLLLGAAALAVTLIRRRSA